MTAYLQSGEHGAVPREMRTTDSPTERSKERKKVRVKEENIKRRERCREKAKTVDNRVMDLAPRGPRPRRQLKYPDNSTTTTTNGDQDTLLVYIQGHVICVILLFFFFFITVKHVFAIDNFNRRKVVFFFFHFVICEGKFSCIIQDNLNARTRTRVMELLRDFTIM